MEIGGWTRLNTIWQPACKVASMSHKPSYVRKMEFRDFKGRLNVIHGWREFPRIFGITWRRHIRRYTDFVSDFRVKPQPVVVARPRKELIAAAVLVLRGHRENIFSAWVKDI